MNFEELLNYTPAFKNLLDFLTINDILRLRCANKLIKVICDIYIENNRKLHIKLFPNGMQKYKKSPRNDFKIYCVELFQINIWITPDIPHLLQNVNVLKLHDCELSLIGNFDNLFEICPKLSHFGIHFRYFAEELHAFIYEKSFLPTRKYPFLKIFEFITYPTFDMNGVAMTFWTKIFITQPQIKTFYTNMYGFEFIDPILQHFKIELDTIKLLWNFDKYSCVVRPFNLIFRASDKNVYKTIQIHCEKSYYSKHKEKFNKIKNHSVTLHDENEIEKIPGWK